jgi:hypothetical protein
MATFAPEREPAGKGGNVPEEFRKPGPEEPEMAPERVPEVGLDAGDAELNASAELEAEVLFQIAHYAEEYEAPASLADVAFEIEEKDSDVHHAMEEAVEKGTPKVEPAIKSLIDQGLIMETEFGGYVTTPDGDEMLQSSEVQSELGGTYESQKHHGNPADKGFDQELEPEPEEKVEETGIPFLTF